MRKLINVRLLVNVRPDEAEALRRRAYRDRKTKSAITREALRVYLGMAAKEEHHEPIRDDLAPSD